MGKSHPDPPLSRAGSQAVTSRIPRTTVAELDRVAAERGTTRNAVVNAALEAGLYDFERADAEKISDPDARARFVAARRRRHEQALSALTPSDRALALKISDHGARARFVAVVSRRVPAK